MSVYKTSFINHMIENGIKYSEVNDNVVRVSYSGENMNSIPVLVIFDEDGDNDVKFKVFTIAKFNDSELAGALVTANNLNKTFRWCKFYIDDDQEMTADYDCYVDAETCGEECLSVVRRIVSICDDAFPSIMKAKKW